MQPSRAIILWISVWALMALPNLTTAGVVDHHCDCGMELDCCQAGLCCNPSTQGATLLPEAPGRRGDLERNPLAVPAPASMDLFTNPWAHSPPGRIPITKRARWLPALPFPKSDVPLLI